VTRPQLDHVLRAAGAITQENVFVVIGSQAILATDGEPAAELVVSVEVDLFPLDTPWKADLIDGSIGERSPFHDTFGYYAYGIGPETAILPWRWLTRALDYTSSACGGARAWCLHPSDLAISKLAAARPKDLDYVRVLFQAGYTDLRQVEELVPELEEPWRSRVRERLQGFVTP
jgi:hypothetical protein